MQPGDLAAPWHNAVFPPRTDVAAAVAWCVVAGAEVALTQRPVDLVAAALASLPLAVRRSAPLVAAVVLALSPAADAALGGHWIEPWSWLLAVVAVAYALGAHADLRVAAAGALFLLAALWGSELRGTGTDYGFLAFLLALSVVSGRAVGTHRRHAARLAGLARRLEAEREAVARLAVAGERRRIAGEMHDAIAHAVSQMVLQAGGAEGMLSFAPDRARTALDAVQCTGRDAVAELHRMLWMLRGVPGHLPDLDAPEPVPARVRLPVRWPAWADVPLAVAAVGALDGPAVAGAAGSRERLVIAAAAAIALPALVLCRRRAGTALALAVASLVGEVLLLGDLLGPAPFVAALAALAALAAQASARRSAAGTGTAAAAIGVVSAVADGIGPSDLPVLALFFGIAFAAGRAVRTQRLQAEALRVATRRLTRERDARARLAVAEERIELARELHDSVAHAVSVMVLQAAAAEQVLDSAPELARRSVRAVQDLGRRAIEELQRLVGMLRDDHDRNPRAPHAQLAQLEALIAQVSEAGLIVDLEVKGERVALSPGLDAAAYRIVQESLTNALKHAGRVRTRVRVRYGPDVLRLEIVDDGHSRARPSRGPGHGLIGMRERAALYGGTLRAGPRRGGGYAVSARLPLTGRRT